MAPQQTQAAAAQDVTKSPAYTLSGHADGSCEAAAKSSMVLGTQWRSPVRLHEARFEDVTVTIMAGARKLST